jgi:D-amino-acid dehydrogenase
MPRSAATLEPGTEPVDTALHAAIHLPDDEVGNCRQFAHLLRPRRSAWARAVPHVGTHRARQDVQVVHLHAPARPLIVDPAPSGSADPQTEPAPLRSPFDAVVMCAAMGSPNCCGRTA